MIHPAVINPPLRHNQVILENKSHTSELPVVVLNLHSLTLIMMTCVLRLSGGCYCDWWKQSYWSDFKGYTVLTAALLTHLHLQLVLTVLLRIKHFITFIHQAGYFHFLTSSSSNCLYYGHSVKVLIHDVQKKNMFIFCLCFVCFSLRFQF